MPLLDGLDEVAKKARASCVQEINNYYQQQLDKHEECPIVICCRREEYETLTTHVNIQNAISILPLTDTQVDTYLEEGGEQMKVLRQALKKDIGLRELAHQPLMLNVFVLAYRGAKSAEVPKGKTPEEMRYTIFARYVERMLKHRETLRGWEPMQMIYWLAFLAKQMQQHDQTVFSLENLQSTWLPSRSSKSLYRSAVALLFAQISALAGQLMLGLAGGMVFGWIYISAVAWGFWLVGLLIGKRDTKIEPAEALTWSWKKARLPMLLGALSGGLGGVLGAGLLTWLFFGLAAVQTAVLISGLTGLPAGGLLAALMKGLSRGQLSDDLSLSPNKRIWRSGKNGLIVGLIFGLVSGLCSVIYSWLSSGTDFSSWVIFLVLIGAIGSGLCNGLAMGLYFGLNAFVRHFILRFALSAGGNLPLKLIPFLDEAARRLLLRKVGGSYIFVHRLLLDYFAKLDDPGFAKRYLLLERRHRKEKNYRVKASKAAVYHKNRNNR